MLLYSWPFITTVQLFNNSSPWIQSRLEYLGEATLTDVQTGVFQGAPKDTCSDSV